MEYHVSSGSIKYVNGPCGIGLSFSRSRLLLLRQYYDHRPKVNNYTLYKNYRMNHFDMQRK